VPVISVLHSSVYTYILSIICSCAFYKLVGEAKWRRNGLANCRVLCCLVASRTPNSEEIGEYY